MCTQKIIYGQNEREKTKTYNIKKEEAKTDILLLFGEQKHIIIDEFRLTEGRQVRGKVYFNAPMASTWIYSGLATARWLSALSAGSHAFHERIQI